MNSIARLAIRITVFLMRSRNDTWLRAAIGEYEYAARGGDGCSWAMGVLTMSIQATAVRAFLPWKRPPGEAPDYLAAAVLGLLVASPAIYLLTALISDSMGAPALLAPLRPWLDTSAFRIVSPIVVLGGLALGVWVNLGAIGTLRLDRDATGSALTLRLRFSAVNVFMLVILGAFLTALAWHLLVEALIGSA